MVERELSDGVADGGFITEEEFREAMEEPGVEFLVEVLRPRGELSVEAQEQLRANMCSYVPSEGVWLFEGEWESCLSEAEFEPLGQIVVPGLGGFSPAHLDEMWKERGL